MGDSESSVPSSPNSSGNSKGSSVSTGLREEYEDLLRYAVVTPNFDGRVQGVVKTKATPTTSTSGPGVHSVEVSHLQLSDEPQETSQPHNSPTPSPPQPTVHGRPDTEAPPPLINNRPHLPVDSRLDPPPTVTGLYPPVETRIDPELVRLDSQLDVWCLELKRNILAEFEQAQLRAKEYYNNELRKEIERLVLQQEQLQTQVERANELLVTYEQSIARKDQIIQTLTKSLQKQKERVEVAKSFSIWRARHSDDKRTTFTTSLAKKHYDRQLKRKILKSWFGLIQGRWKQRVERACQVKAEEVCHQLVGDHQEQLANMKRLYDEAQLEISHLQQERDIFEENMKKAFMRGVCALNMEAMSMFQQQPDDQPSTGCHDNSNPTPILTRPPSKGQSRDGHVISKRRDKGPTIKVERHKTSQ